MSSTAGWYPDPTSTEHLRYWDGANWTDDVSRIEDWGEPDAAPAVEAAPPIDTTPALAAVPTMPAAVTLPAPPEPPTYEPPPSPFAPPVNLSPPVQAGPAVADPMAGLPPPPTGYEAHRVYEPSWSPPTGPASPDMQNPAWGAGPVAPVAPVAPVVPVAPAAAMPAWGTPQPGAPVAPLAPGAPVAPLGMQPEAQSSPTFGGVQPRPAAAYRTYGAETRPVRSISARRAWAAALMGLQSALPLFYGFAALAGAAMFSSMSNEIAIPGSVSGEFAVVGFLFMLYGLALFFGSVGVGLMRGWGRLLAYITQGLMIVLAAIILFASGGRGFLSALIVALLPAIVIFLVATDED